MSDLPGINQMIQPAGLNRARAAGYVGVSAGHFDKMLRDKLLPQPRLADGVLLWLRIELDEALFELAIRENEGENSCDTAFGV